MPLGMPLGLTALLILLSGGRLGFAAPPEAAPRPLETLVVTLVQARFPRPQKEPDVPKSLVGQVVDKEGKALAQAVVHLKNKRTLDVNTHISDEQGNYRFRGLNPDIDYEVHAEFQGASSSKRGVSSFDDRKEVYLVLEIDTSN